MNQQRQYWFACVVMIGLCFGSSKQARADSAAEVLGEAVTLTQAFGDVLGEAKSDESAAVAAGKVAELAKTAAALKARADKIDPPTEEQKQEIAKAIGDGANTASQILLGAHARLASREGDAFATLKKTSDAFSESIGSVITRLGGASLEDSHDRLMSDAVGIMNTMAELLASAKDEASAKVVAGKIQAMEFRTKGFQSRAELLGEPDPQKTQALVEKYMAGLMKSMQKVQAEVVRISQDPKLAEVLGDALQSLQNFGN